MQKLRANTVTANMQQHNTHTHTHRQHQRTTTTKEDNTTHIDVTNTSTSIKLQSNHLHHMIACTISDGVLRCLDYTATPTYVGVWSVMDSEVCGLNIYTSVIGLIARGARMDGRLAAAGCGCCTYSCCGQCAASQRNRCGYGTIDGWSMLSIIRFRRPTSLTKPTGVSWSKATAKE